MKRNRARVPPPSSVLIAACLLLLASPALAAEAPRAAAMVRLPGGLFRMGELTGPLRDTVSYDRVRSFLLDVTEVTVAAYAECVKAKRCTPANATVKWDVITPADRTKWSAYCNQDRPDRADHPVNCVDWNQAKAYCAWAGKRLPSEEEWEWAARNGKNGTAYPWGNDEPQDQLCWSGGDADDVAEERPSGTCPAGSHPAGDSAAGVKDLAGNVWEWTSSASVVAADSRGRGGTPVKIARGGGWTDTDPKMVTAAVKFPDLPSRRDTRLGFRCAKSP